MQISLRRRPALVWLLTVVALVAAATFTRPSWQPWLTAQVGAGGESPDATHDEHDAEHDQDNAHDHGVPADAIELSPTALQNIDFRPFTVKPGVYERTTRLPAIVVERPGKSQIHITAPLTGVITKIAPLEGAAIEPDSELFEIRLTHEELVAAQRDLLQTAESLDVENREVERLQSLTSGVVAGQRVLERQYEQQKLEASLRAARQALILHDLSEEQIDGILESRKLVQSLTVRAPAHSHDDDGSCDAEHLFHVQDLPVKLGQHVEAGEVLCVIADHCELYIEGRAFEDDAARLREVAQNDQSVSASFLTGDRETDRVDDLKILYLADRIEPETRAFHFYLRLPNEVVLDRTADDGRRFLSWRFKPGQRLELQIPVERWEDRIVLPVDAVVDDGAEMYVFRQNGKRFERVPVHVEYRDRESAVVAKDGALFPGDVVAAQGAYQMNLALKNQSGGAIDPHAGHSH